MMIRLLFAFGFTMIVAGAALLVLHWRRGAEEVE